MKEVSPPSAGSDPLIVLAGGDPVGDGGAQRIAGWEDANLPRQYTPVAPNDEGYRVLIDAVKAIDLAAHVKADVIGQAVVFHKWGDLVRFLIEIDGEDRKIVRVSALDHLLE